MRKRENTDRSSYLGLSQGSKTKVSSESGNESNGYRNDKEALLKTSGVCWEHARFSKDPLKYIAVS